MSEKAVREMTFEEEAAFYEAEARAEFAKETGGGDSAGVNNILRRGMRIIRKAREALTAVPTWIPITERMPDEFAEYLCVVLRPIPGGKYVREERLLWCDYDKSWNCDGLIVTHWMPRPDLPKGD